MSLYGQYREHIGSHGWAVICVPGNPSFAYSIGLTLQGKPEVLIVGPVPPDALGAIVNTVATLVQDRDLRPGATVYEALQKGMPLKIIEPDQQVALSYTSQAEHFFQGEGITGLRVVQAVLPDQHGKLPGDPDCDPEWAATQELSSQ